MERRKRPPKPPPKDPANPSPNYGKTFPADHLQPDEVRAMLAILDKDDPVSIRNRTLLIVLWRSGLRISEALALRPYDIDLERRTIRVLHGKGDKARTVAIDAGAVTAVREWYAVRLVWTGGGRDDLPVFCTQAGSAILPSYIRVMLPRVARRAGVARRVHAHIFRHTFAVELIQARTPLPYIQQLLGHESLATTAAYIASLSPEDALDAVRDREW